MKKMKYKPTLLISTLLLLAGCSFQVRHEPFTAFSDDHDQYRKIEGVNYVKPAALKKPYYDILRSQKKQPMPSSGAQKLLVLPVLFPDYDIKNFDKSGGATSLIHLQNAFFGTSAITKWYSAASYYDASSYGKLHLTGEVAPWFTLPEKYSVANIRTLVRNNNDKVTVSSDIANLALEHFVNNGGELDLFDQNNDDVIDGVYVIYGYPYENNDATNIFWAFAANSNKKSNTLEKAINAYAWSSYHYMGLGQGQKVDAHTYIHELGHILGLEDYYNTNNLDQYAPLGGFDIMDYTLGDHSGFSKMLLKWARPFYVTGVGEITLRPFGESGDLLLIKAGWNQSATDEYLLLEYYTPTHLNEQDSRLNAPFKLPRQSGLKVYHVDARTVYEIKDNGKTTYYYANSYEGDTRGVNELLAHSNSSGSANGAPIRDYVLYSLLEPAESENIKNGGFANVHSLFQERDDFGINYYEDFTFNDGTKLPYAFEIVASSKEGITINFTKVEH